MDVKIKDKTDNKLFSRQEIEFSLESEKVPTRKELREKIAALQNSKLELVVVDKIKQRFGSKEMRGTARIYGSEKMLKRIEPAFLVGRNAGKKKTPGKEEVSVRKAEGEAKEEKTGKKKEAQAEKTIKEEPAEKAEEKKETRAGEKEGDK